MTVGLGSAAPELVDAAHARGSAARERGDAATARGHAFYSRATFKSLRRRAKKRGATKSKPGAITFVQRFGSALNLNVHFHAVVPDGVFVCEEGAVRFVALGAPPMTS